MLCLLLTGCFGGKGDPEYGVERKLRFPGIRKQTWAVAPAINLSGQRSVDPLLQGDLLFQEVSQTEGLIGVPVNRVIEAMAALGFEQVQSSDEGAMICEALDVDALVVPTVTMYEPYDPPKFGASLTLFFRGGAVRTEWDVEVRDLQRMSSSTAVTAYTPPTTFLQTSGVFDAAEGSTRKMLWAYTQGRNDPMSAAMEREYLMAMDRYCTFGYATLLEELLNTPGASGPVVQRNSSNSRLASGR
ncbi:MAG: hypothetical protein AAF743_06255 [Planctomycetota bacterium]